MEIEHLKEISDIPKPMINFVQQDYGEWRYFLEFASAYFKARLIQKPIVVEIGIMHNIQKLFYRGLLNAEYIGMDINVNNNPDILGDSSKRETVEKLEAHLAGRPIDLLFIDGNHSYSGVKADFELYAPLTKHLIAFHDIQSVTNRAEDVNLYWNEVTKSNQFMTVVFHRYNTDVDLGENKFAHMGIGVVVKNNE